MILSLKEFSEYMNWKNAEIQYFRMAGNTLRLDVNFKTYQQNKRCKLNADHADMRTHIVFRDVTLFTDDYFSPLEKLLSRFKDVYVCSSNKMNERGEFVIDDCIRIVCADVELTELSHERDFGYQMNS